MDKVVCAHRHQPASPSYFSLLNSQLIISYSSDQSPKSPALLLLPALIDAVILLLSKQPLPGCSSAGTQGKVAPNPWGTLDPQKSLQNLLPGANPACSERAP